ncbi:Crp/Fnr family transcriptional regulator [Aliamphritea spongicola]|uniref:Crp/Fnr family transcriptional regulator n=1 Tax=Aliamphritea spongicola TaxID=707589 RepID=UPI00196A7FE5|nr:Crp/Fnr family transcriptional regulator [Aliamphritea spongicola]MBN3562080.1 Crp/Fnr family transcriptional regulator [Aliamphritea spongicola]
MKTLQAESLLKEFGLPYFRELASFGALSDEMIRNMVHKGVCVQLEQGEILKPYESPVDGFSIVLKGDIAFYKHCETHDVLTRHFLAGEQIGFDSMIAMIPNSGTEIAFDDSIVLQISATQFFDLHVDFPNDFGLFMINLSRELSREIAMLEDVVGKSTGWQA